MTPGDSTDDLVRVPAGTAGSPVVTTLLPVYEHHDDYLLRAVGSMLAQTDPHWRLLIVTEEPVLEQLERLLAEPLGDERIAMTVNEGRKLAGAFNTGMRMAGTEFTAILLGDDLWAPSAVQVLAEAMDRHPEADFLHSSRQVIDESGDAISSVQPSRPGVSLADFGATSPVKHLLCWRRRLALSIGGMDESLDSVGVDDFDFPWSMAEAGAVFREIPECLYLYRDHRESYRLTTHLPLAHHRREIARILAKHGFDEHAIGDAIGDAERGYLRQCLYRSRFDRLLKRAGRHSPKAGWRERYL